MVYNMTRDGVTQSLLGACMCCRLRGMLVVNRWVHPDKARSTGFGSLVHGVLDWMYHQTQAPAQRAIEMQVALWVRGNRTALSALKAQEVEGAAAIAGVVLSEYAQAYEKDWTEKRFTGVEQVFDQRFGEERIRGKIDGEFHAKDGTVWLMEHKTKSRIEEDFLQQALAFDFQNLFYITAWELSHKLCATDVRGTLYNIIRTPQHKQHQGEDLRAFAERVRAEIRKDPKHFFVRYEIPYTTADRKRFVEELKWKLDDMREVLEGRRPAYRNEFACRAPYSCEYLPACASGLMTGFAQRPKLFEELA
jgi:hypothetical protein